MPHNMGTADRVIRAAIVAPILLVIALVAVDTVAIGTALVVFALVMLLTGALGSCPLYVPLRIDTHRAPHRTA